jgi:IclR family pca regulon transcriptional regulator
MARRESDPDFIEAIARGLDVLRCFPPRARMSLSEVAAATGLARPTARRILKTLEVLGYVRSSEAGYVLTARCLELGTVYVENLGLWDIVQPHLEALVAQTHESSSLAQLDGSDIVYVGRVAVPKLIALAVTIGTRFPAPSTSLGKVLLADLSPEQLERTLAEPSRSGVTPRHTPTGEELAVALKQVRAQGWASTDENLASGVRSAAAPVRDSRGKVVAAVNVTVHAAETAMEQLIEEHLPRLLATAGRISADLARLDHLPISSGA